MRKQFGISAPRTAVRTRLPWWGRGAVVLALAAVVAGMWWWGFDFGQILGGVNRKEIEARIANLESEAARLRAEAGDLRARNSQLESDVAMNRGALQALTRQAADLATENAQLKEEAAFWQKLVADSGKQVGFSMPRLSIEREADGLYRYSLLVTRGGNPSDDFEGHVVLQAALTPATAGGMIPAPQTLTLPDDQPDAKGPLELRFKYYQRVEGMLRVPPGTRISALTARAYENGSANPRATRSLTNP
jgi:hypothetical protein